MDKLERLAEDLKYALRSKKRREKDKERLRELYREEAKMMSQFEKRDLKWRADHPDNPINYRELLPRIDLGLKPRKQNALIDDDVLKDIARRKAIIEVNDKKRKLNARQAYEGKKYQDDLNKIDRDRDESLDSLSNRISERRRASKEKRHKNGMINSSITRLVDDEILRDGLYKLDDIRERALSKKALRDANYRRISDDYEGAYSAVENERKDREDRHFRSLKRRNESEHDRVDRYNESIARRQRAMDFDREDKVGRLERKRAAVARAEAYAEKYGYTGEKRDEYESRYLIALALYDQMPKSKAIDAIENNYNLRRYLGRYYSNLVAEQRMRKI